METEFTRGKLQVYSVESVGPEDATCIVRCVGGIARTGRRFSVDASLDPSGEVAPITLERIIRYGRTVDFVDPPHNAKVHFSGRGVSALVRGVVVVSAES